MRWNREDSQKHPVEAILTGIIIAVAGTVYWRFNPQAWWMVFPVVFGGAIPVSKGIRRLIAARVNKPKPSRLTESEKASENERTVLRIAQAQSGIVTPSLIVLNSTLSLEEAERILDGLTKKGHAGMRVLDDGRINYEFSEFRR